LHHSQDGNNREGPTPVIMVTANEGGKSAYRQKCIICIKGREQTITMAAPRNNIIAIARNIEKNVTLTGQQQQVQHGPEAWGRNKIARISFTNVLAETMNGATEWNGTYHSRHVPPCQHRTM